LCRAGHRDGGQRQEVQAANDIHADYVIVSRSSFPNLCNSDEVNHAV
jgi:hypothetical protein